MEVEIAVLPALAGTLTLPIPEPLYFGEPTPSYPYRFLGCRHVEGTPADSCTVRDEAEAAAVLGSFLRDLHGRAAPPGMPIDPLRKADPQANISRMQRRFSSLTRAQAGERILEWARSEAEFADPGHQMAPSHGDLYPRHVLVGSEGQVSGVIDWGDACLCPPAADLSLAWSMFGEEARETFWAAYGRRLPPTEANAARLRAGMYGLALLAYGLDEEDETASRFGRMALRRILPADLSREALGGSA